jgi:hypothetical protein
MQSELIKVVIDASKEFAMAHPVATVVIVGFVIVGYVATKYLTKDSEKKDEDRDVENNRRGKIRKS